MVKFKLWQKSLLSLGIISTIFGGTIVSLYFYSKTPQGKGLSHYTSLSLKNNLADFKDVKKYSWFFKDPITNEKVGDYNYKTNKVDGINFINWLSDFEIKTKKTPVFIVRGGPIEFRNYYSDAIFPKTFISFVEWFSHEIPWGPELSSLSYFKISKGIKKKDNGTVTLGSYSHVDKRTKRIDFSPDSFFNESTNTRFIMKFLNKGITKNQIPILIKYINQTNEKMKKEYGKEWKDHAIRLYSLEKNGDEYIPFVSKIGNLIDNIERKSSLYLENISDIDVIWDEKTMTIKTIERDSYKINSEKNLPNIKIWSSFFDKDWKGLSFEWLKSTTQHEYGHLQTLNNIHSGANNYVGLNIPSIGPNSANNQIDFNELNRYFEARAPQIRALKVSVNLIKKNSKDQWEWNFYKDRLKDWEDGKIKIKPDAKDFDQIAFEYKSDGSSKWTRETAEKIFGNKLDPNNPEKAPYKINIDEFIEKIRAGERPRFFMYSFQDARKFAEITKIPVSALYLMNSIDSFSATKNPTLTSNFGFALGRNGTSFFLDTKKDKDKVKHLKFLDKNKKFSEIEDIFLEIEDYYGEKILIKKSLIKPPLRTIVDFKSWNGIKYVINPKLKDRYGKPLTVAKQKEVKDLLNSITSKSKFGYLRGNERLLNIIANVGTPSNIEKIYDISKNRMFFTSELNNWRSHRRYRNTIFNIISLPLLPLYENSRFRIYFSIKEFEIEDNGKIYKKDSNEVKKLLENHATYHFIFSGKSYINLYIKKNSLANSKFKNPIVKKIKISAIYKGFIRPPLNPNASNKNNPELKKWFQSYNTGSARTINAYFSHYHFSFSEVLTRDWLQITKNIDDKFSYHYNSNFFPISNRYFKHFFDPSSILNRIYNKESKRTYDLVFNPLYENTHYLPNPKKRNLDFMKEFVMKMYDDLIKSKDKKENEFAKTFVFKELDLRQYELASTKYWNSMSFLNLKNFKGKTEKWTEDFLYRPTSKEYELYLNFFTPFGDKKNNWSNISMSKNSYFEDRWVRSSMAIKSDEEGTSKSWVFYDNNGDSVKYNGDLLSINGQPIKTRAEAYWTFLLKSHGVGLRNISSMFISPERDAVAMWGFIPKKYKTSIKYLQFKNVKTKKQLIKKIRFNVDNLFYYDGSMNNQIKRTLADENFVSWNIDYTSMGSWVDSEISNGDWEINFVDDNGKKIKIVWNDKKITMTGNGNMKISNNKKSTNHIVSLNWFDKIFTPIYIEQNKEGKDIIHIKNEFSI